MKNKKMNSEQKPEKNHKNLCRKSVPPLKRWQEKYCSKCDKPCNPSEERFRNCVLCDLAFALTALVPKNPKDEIKKVERSRIE